MNYAPRGVKVFPMTSNLIDNQCPLLILAHLSTYECYVYEFTWEFHGGYSRFFYLESCPATWNKYYRRHFTPCSLIPFNINMVLINQVTGKTPRKLDINDEIINILDMFYQLTKKGIDVLLIYLNITWLNNYPHPVMFSL